MNQETVTNLLKIVSDNYNQIAADFNLTRKKEIWPEITKLTADIKDGDRILDLGCGNGRLIEALKDKKIEYLGLDNSQELIKLAQANYPAYKFIVSDILDLENISEIKPEKFDYIFCLATLQHLPGRELKIEALRKMENKLALGGKIIISNWNMYAQRKYRRLIFKTFFNKLAGKNKLDFGDILFPWKNSRGEIVSSRYYHAFLKRELASLASEAGCHILKLYKDRYNYWLILNKKH